MTSPEARSLTRMTRCWSTIVCIIALASCWLPSAQAQTPKGRVNVAANAPRQSGTPQQLKVMARINGQDISRNQLAQACMRRFGQEVLESLVNKQVIWQACQARNIVITEQHVNDEVTRMAQNFNLTPQALLQTLHRNRDISPEKYRREIVWPMLALKALAASQIQVTQEELQQAVESEYGEKIKARIIAVDSRQKAEQLRAKAMASPENFGKLAKDESQDQSASVEGLIPPIRRYAGNDEFERAAFALQPGQVSSIVQVGNQFVIIKCEKRLPAMYLSATLRKNAEQRLMDRLQDQKLRVASATLLKRLQDEAKVVNIYNDPQLSKQMQGVAATINGKPIAIALLSEECLQRHGPDVLVGEINRVLLLQELHKRGKTVSQAAIDQEIARAAEAFGALKKDGTPDIDHWLKTVTSEDGITVELYIADAVWPTVALKTLVTEQVGVTDEDLKKGFESNYGERVRVQAIVLSNHRQAQKVWQDAKANNTEEFFAQLADQYSIEPISSANMGQVPPIRRHGGQPAVEDKAFSLSPGELSSIIAIGDKYIILRCLGRTKPVVKELDEEVRRELVKDLQEKKIRLAMSKEFDRINKTAQIDNFLSGTTQSGRRGQNGPVFPQATQNGPVRR